MSYKSTTIANVVQKLNTRFFIPAIQRPFVWDEQQVTKLLDSLMKGYPIGTFLFWEVLDEYKENWEFYRFVEHFRQGEIPNERADAQHGNEVVLVLDGQQRLTSLLIALNGSYTTRQKYKRRHSTTAWTTKKLFLNLLKSPEVTDEDSIAEDITYGFEFHSTAPKSASGVWFKVSDILTFRDDGTFEDHVDQLNSQLEDEGRDTAERRLVRRNLERLYRIVWKEEIVCYYTERTQSYDKVLDIFVRVNSGGEVLSKSDLLMSLVTLKWDNYDARQELAFLQRHLNDGLSTPNDFDRDFILRASLLLSELPYVFAVDSFTRKNIELIESNWRDIKASLEVAARLVNSFGLSKVRGNLTSNNSVMPIAHYVFRLRRKGLSDDAVEAVLRGNAQRIRIWLVSSLFAGVFAGAADSTVVLARRVIDEHLVEDFDFPLSALTERMAARGRSAAWDTERIEQFLDLAATNRGLFAPLTLLYDSNDWETTPHQRAFVFPQDIGSPDELDKAGMTLSAIEAHAENSARLANMMLLTGEELSEYKELGYEEWLHIRTPADRMRHLLPKLASYELKSLAEFIIEREELISDRLRNLTRTRVSESALASDLGKELAVG